MLYTNYTCAMEVCKKDKTKPATSNFSLFKKRTDQSKSRHSPRVAGKIIAEICLAIPRQLMQNLQQSWLCDCVHICKKGNSGDVQLSQEITENNVRQSRKIATMLKLNGKLQALN